MTTAYLPPSTEMTVMERRRTLEKRHRQMDRYMRQFPSLAGPKTRSEKIGDVVAQSVLGLCMASFYAAASVVLAVLALVAIASIFATFFMLLGLVLNPSWLLVAQTVAVCAFGVIAPGSIIVKVLS